TITKSELQSLENMIFGGQLKREELEQELGGPVNLIPMIISLYGLSKEHVDSEFADFINKYQMNSQQIDFLNDIKEFFTTNGKIDPQKLYDGKFGEYHPQAVDGVFNQQQADQLFEIISKMNKSAG